MRRFVLDPWVNRLLNRRVTYGVGRRILVGESLIKIVVWKNF
jgi:hypothetical protein